MSLSLYIYRERERARDLYLSLSLSLYTYIYIYVCTQTSRRRWAELNKQRDAYYQGILFKCAEADVINVIIGIIVCVIII